MPWSFSYSVSSRAITLSLLVGLCWEPIVAHSEWADPTYLDELLNQVIRTKLADSRYWHLLVHYRRNLVLSGYRSRIDDPAFFLSPQGKTDPQAELEATLRAFFSTEEINGSGQPAQCAYIARYQWLKTALSIDARRLPPQPCPQFQEWYDSFSPDAVTLVFPAAYMNNPASLFGHTLLRVDQKEQTEQTRLLASSINFGAKVTSTNWLSYVVSGIGGGFRGHFFIKPYYLLVKEYGDFENRDIWEYRLQLTPAQIERLLMHVWELKESYFDYFFLSENCAYQLLPLLEVANPELHLTDRLWLWTIPADTVRLLNNQPGLIGEITYRPAPSTQIRHGYSLLSSSEQQVVKTLLHAPSTVPLQALDELPPTRRALSLELAISHLQYQHSQEEKRKITPKQERLHQLLTMRSRLEADAPEVAIPPFVTQPDSGHNSLRVGLSWGWRQHDWFEELTVRAGYHDLLDPTPGYTPDAQIEILALSVRHYHRRDRIRLNQLTLVDAISLSPIEPLFFAPSWKGRVELSTLGRRNCRYCQNFTLNGGLGLSVQTSWIRREVYFLLPEVDVEASRGFTPNYRIGAGGTAGILVQFSDRWKALLSGTYVRYPLGETGEEFRGSVRQEYTLRQNLALRCEYRYRRHDSEARLSLYAYF